MNKRLVFLDDIRIPSDCFSYMPEPEKELYSTPLGFWNVVRNYDEFVDDIESYGLPDFVSFDHDLSDEHYSTTMYDGNQTTYNQLYKDFKEKTGYDCAKWLVNYCSVNGLPLPKYSVHSMNPVGRDNILGLFKSFEKFKERMS